ncbi:prohibitin [Sigmodon hispidus]
MAVEVFESIGKFLLTLALAVVVVNSALYNVDAGHRAVIFDRFHGVKDIEVLPSTITEILRSVVARFDTGELITQRELVSRQVSDDLTERAATFELILDDVSLTHLTFRKEFTEAVEAKQVAQQKAERARFVVEKAKQQKKAAIISVEGDSKAAELIANSLATAGDGLIELCNLEAAEDIAYQLSCSRNITYLPAGQSVLLQLPQ